MMSVKYDVLDCIDSDDYVGEQFQQNWVNKMNK